MRRRRDPRAERLARMVVAGGPRLRLLVHAEPGQPGRARIDPRAERAARLVPGTTRPRLDRTQRTRSAPGAAAPPGPVATPRLRARDPTRRVLVVADAPGGRLTRHDRQLLGAARTLADPEGGAVVLVSGGDTGPDDAPGADALLAVPGSDDPARLGLQIASIIRALDPLHVLFPETAAGGDLARRVAVVLDEPLLCGIEALSPAAAIRPACARRIERRTPPTRLLTLEPDRAATYRGPEREIDRLETAAAIDETGLPPPCFRELPGDPSDQPLAEAPFVLAAGHGVTDLDAFRRLAERLQASPGASRMLCDAGLMPRSAQVGASGTVLSGLCYLALGISGAPQHLQGIGAVPHVVAVNTDLHAAMMARAELAIVADAQAVMQAMLTLLERGE